MSSLEGTKTKENLESAYREKSEIRCRYAYYAAQAKKEGYEQIAGMFQQASEYNKEHARVWFKLLNDGIGDTKENVRQAVQTERRLWTEQYLAYAEQAKEEGFDQIATLFEGMAAISKMQERGFAHMEQALETQSVFARQETLR
ncbi:MAG: rubrerythrin family protein, partial [Christensenellales bacterium]